MQVCNIVVYIIVPCRLPFKGWKEVMKTFPPNLRMTVVSLY